MVKKYPNTKKSRNQLPEEPGGYNLKNRQGKRGNSLLVRKRR